MPRGIRYSNLFYPDFVRLPEHTSYIVNISGRLGCVFLHRHLEPVEALDFDNRIFHEERDGRRHWDLQRPIEMPREHRTALESEGRLIYVFEDVLYYRHFRRRDFTELVIAHEVEDVDSITTEEKEHHGRVLDQFILAYRAFTSDVAVRMPNDLFGEYPLIRFGVHQYTDEELRRPEHERVSELRDVGIRFESVPLGAHPYALAPPSIDPEKVCPIISDFLATGDAIPAPQTILIQAVEALKISRDYRHALLLAFFSIEQVVTETLEDIKKEAGIPEKTVKKFRAGEFGISYRINIELPLVFPPESLVRKLIPELDKANGYRNGVVHKQHDPTFEEAAFVIKTGDQLIKALSRESIGAERAAEPVSPARPARPPQAG